jgi:outer membrane lipoprotein-sorting protein
MAVEVGERDGLTRRVELLDGQGNAVLTQYFTDVAVNIPLDAKQFVFEPPKEVKVVDIPPPEIPEESPPSPP